jgi:rhodanese-related sulfurtransferase
MHVATMFQDAKHSFFKIPRTERGENYYRAAVRASTALGLRRMVFVHNKFISCDELEQLLKSGKKVLMVDARKPSEYKHSHIKHAVNVHAMHHIPDIILRKVPKNFPIVVYCAVGLRSGWLTARFAKKGFTSVSTLKGGFYKWVNEGRCNTFNCDGDPVNTVKPQHAVAKMLLNSTLVGQVMKNRGEYDPADQIGGREDKNDLYDKGKLTKRRAHTGYASEQLKTLGIITEQGEPLDSLLTTNETANEPVVPQ